MPHRIRLCLRWLSVMVAVGCGSGYYQGPDDSRMVNGTGGDAGARAENGAEGGVGNEAPLGAGGSEVGGPDDPTDDGLAGRGGGPGIDVPLGMAGDGGVASDLDDPVGSPSNRIGPEGGTLTADGVIVTIPAGALREVLELDLAAWADSSGVTISLMGGSETDHITFELPVHVELMAEAWPPEQNGVVLRLAEDGWLEFVSELDAIDSLAGYSATKFSEHYLKRLQGPLPAVDSRWPTHTEGDAQSKERSELGDPAIDNFVGAQGQHCLARLDAAGYDPVYTRSGSKLVDQCAQEPPPPAWPTREVESRGCLEGALGSRELSARIARLNVLIDETFSHEYELWINGAWDSSHAFGRTSVRQEPSYHDSGSAADLVLCRMTSRGCEKVTTRSDYKGLQGILYDLSVEAGFTWVWFEPEKKGSSESTHIHVSVSSPSVFQGGSDACTCGGLNDEACLRVLDSEGKAEPLDCSEGLAALSEPLPFSVRFTAEYDPLWEVGVNHCYAGMMGRWVSWTSRPEADFGHVVLIDRHGTANAVSDWYLTLPPDHLDIEAWMAASAAQYDRMTFSSPYPTTIDPRYWALAHVELEADASVHWYQPCDESFYYPENFDLSAGGAFCTEVATGMMQDPPSSDASPLMGLSTPHSVHTWLEPCDGTLCGTFQMRKF